MQSKEKKSVLRRNQQKTAGTKLVYSAVVRANAFKKQNYNR